MGKGFLSEAGEAWLALELGKHCLALQQCVKLSQAMRQAGTRFVKAIGVKLHVHTHRQYGPTTGNIVVPHDAVDCVKQHICATFVPWYRWHTTIASELEETHTHTHYTCALCVRT